ncbi:MAG: FAD-binding oxidoreductase [Acidobacteriota bacterium]
MNRFGTGNRMWRARFPVSDDTDCGWLHDTPGLPPSPALGGDVDADLIVIGAGFTGLAAAHRCAGLRPDWRVVVLEAQHAGAGGSGRASGFVVDQAGFVGAKPKADAGRFLRLSHAGIAALDHARTRFDIDCDWDDRGWLHIAASDAGVQGLASLTPWLESIGRRYEHLDRAALRRLTGTDFYRAAVRMPGSVLVHVGKLVHGIAAALPESVALYQHTPVTSIETRDGEVIVSTPAATVRASRVVVALNAYAPMLGLLRDRLFPLVTFGSLTRPLTSAEQDLLGDEPEWGLLAQDPMGSSLRRTRDQRLLIRNTIHYTRDASAAASVRQNAVAEHRKALTARWPSLADIELESTWAGPMGTTPSLRPFFGRIARGLVTAGAFTGAGIAMGTVLGRLMVDELLGVESPLLTDARRLTPPNRLPPEPFLSPGITWKTKQMNASAGAAL